MRPEILARVDLYRNTGVCSSPDGPVCLGEHVEVVLFATGYLRAHVVARVRSREENGELAWVEGERHEPAKSTLLTDEEWSLAFGALRHHQPVGTLRPRWSVIR